MFDRRRVISHKGGYNPYGLRDQYNRSLSKEETIDFFNSIGMNDEELDLLNRYIIDNKYGSFYDNAYMLYDDRGKGLNFIEGLRAYKDAEEDYLSRNFDMTCHDEDKSWEVKVRDLKPHKGYISLTIICNGNKFHTYTGISVKELWICFPYIDKATTLSTPDDLYWNEDELYRLLRNEVEAISIAQVIKAVKGQIYDTSECFDIMKDDIVF